MVKHSNVQSQSWVRKVLYMPTGRRDGRLSSRCVALKMELLWLRDFFRRLPEAERNDPELLVKVGGVLLAVQCWRCSGAS